MRSKRCGLLVTDVAQSVTALDTSVRPTKHGWIDHYGVRVMYSHGTKNYILDGGPNPPMDYFWATCIGHVPDTHKAKSKEGQFLLMCQGHTCWSGVSVCDPADWPVSQWILLYKKSASTCNVASSQITRLLSQQLHLFTHLHGPWSGTPCRTTSAHSRTMSPLGRGLKTWLFSRY